MSNTRWLFHLRSLPQAALAVAACASTSAALAQNVVNGETLYNQRVNFPISGLLNCADCHGPAYLFKNASSAGAIASAISADRGGMKIYSFLTTPQLTDIAGYVAIATAPPLSPPIGSPPTSGPAPVTPSASPNPVMFTSTQVGARSATVNILFTNTGMTNVTLGTPVLLSASGDAAEFLVDTPTSGTQCIAGRVMAAGTSCTFAAKFAPNAAGARASTWTINFTGVAPRTLTLQGTATTTVAAPAPAPAPPPSSATAPTSGGGGSLDWTSLLGLAALSGLAGVRRRSPR